MRSPTADVLLAIEARSAAFPVVFVGDLLADTGLSPKDLREALLRLYDAGAIELRPHSGVQALTAKGRDACPKGMKGVPMSGVRLLQGATMQPNASYHDRLVKHYGVTDSPYAGGYLLPGGQFLDFSEGSGSRSQDHRNVTWVLPANWEGPRDTRWDGLVRVAKKAMMYRWMPEAWSIEAWTLPTAKQLDAIEALAEMQTLTVEGHDGNRNYAATYEPYESREAWQDLLRFFRGGDVNKTFEPNPPWADKAILDAWPKALRFAKTHGLPMPPANLNIGRKATFKEYGCGFFGCVFPTSDDDVVFKASSDEAETDFILRASTLGPDVDLEGLVRYYGVLPVPGQRRGHDIALIWREAAREAGKLDNHTKGNPDLARFAGRLTQAVWFAIGVRNAVRKHRKDAVEFLQAVEQWVPEVGQNLEKHVPRILDWKKAQAELWDSSGKAGPAFETAMNIGAYALVCTSMATEGPGELVGSTMISLLRHGIVLADVHTQNVGVVERDGQDAWVITDPGNQVLVDPLSPRIVHGQWAATPPTKSLAANASDQEFMGGMAKYGPASAVAIMPVTLPSYLAYRAYLKRRAKRRREKR